MAAKRQPRKQTTQKHFACQGRNKDAPRRNTPPRAAGQRPQSLCAGPGPQAARTRDLQEVSRVGCARPGSDTRDAAAGQISSPGRSSVSFAPPPGPQHKTKRHSPPVGEGKVARFPCALRWCRNGDGGRAGPGAPHAALGARPPARKRRACWPGQAERRASRAPQHPRSVQMQTRAFPLRGVWTGVGKSTGEGRVCSAKGKHRRPGRRAGSVAGRGPRARRQRRRRLRAPPARPFEKAGPGRALPSWEGDLDQRVWATRPAVPIPTRRRPGRGPPRVCALQLADLPNFGWRLARSGPGAAGFCAEQPRSGFRARAGAGGEGTVPECSRWRGGPRGFGAMISGFLY